MNLLHDPGLGSLLVVEGEDLFEPELFFQDLRHGPRIVDRILEVDVRVAVMVDPDDQGEHPVVQMELLKPAGFDVLCYDLDAADFRLFGVEKRIGENQNQKRNAAHHRSPWV